MPAQQQTILFARTRRRAARRLGQLYDEAIAPTGLASPQALLLAQIDKLGARALSRCARIRATGAPNAA